MSQITNAFLLLLFKKMYIISFCCFLLISFQCTTKSVLRFDRLTKAAEKNDFISVINTIKKKPKLYGKINRFLYYFDIGTLFHYANQYDSSNIYLNEASEIYNELFTKSITTEAAALLTNDNVRPYRSKPYEMIFLHQIMAFNFLAKSDFSSALVESRRTQLLINEWKRKDRKDVKYTSDGLFHYISALAYSHIGEPDNAAISLYKSVKAYQQGVVSLPDPIKDLAYYTFKQNDRENDIKNLKISTHNPIDRVIGLDNKKSELILVGYAGRGPVLAENKWWGTWVKDGMLILHYNRKGDGKKETMTLPAPSIPDDSEKEGKKTKSGTTFHIKFTMPSLKTFPSKSKYFSVTSQSIPSPVTSYKVNDLDKLCEKYLEDTRTNTVIRTTIRVVARTIASEKTKNKLESDNAFANLLVNFGVDLLSDQLEQADTRTGFLVPKTIHLARIPVKAGTHNFTVAAHTNSGAVVHSKNFEGINIKPGEKKLIFYSSLE
mgnify:CR=1 FL=1